MKRLAFDVAVVLAIVGVAAWVLASRGSGPARAFLSPEDAGAYGVAKYANDYSGALDGRPRLLWLRNDGGGHFSAKYVVRATGVADANYVVTMIRSEWQVTDVQVSP